MCKRSSYFIFNSGEIHEKMGSGEGHEKCTVSGIADRRNPQTAEEAR